jgi:hypothetical protein
VEDAWSAASRRVLSDGDRAESAYYQALAKRKCDIAGAVSLVEQARRLAPADARFPYTEAYLKWRLADKRGYLGETALDEAIQLSEEALAGDTHDPLGEINVRNNLACFHCEMARRSHSTRRTGYVTKALEYSEGLPSYHRLFRRMHGHWLDTRAWALCLLAEDVMEGNTEAEADKLVDAVAEAVQLSRETMELDRDDETIKRRARQALEVKRKAAKLLRDEAKQHMAEAQESFESGSFYKAQALRSAAYLFDPPLTSDAEFQTDLRSERGLSLLVELKRLLRGTASREEKQEFVEKVDRVIQEYRKRSDKTLP